MFNEFKEFAMKGNLVDMAVGFVMGGAFATVVTAFIQGVFLPALSPVLGGLDFGSWVYEMAPAVLAEDGSVVTEAVSIKIGEFIWGEVEQNQSLTFGLGLGTAIYFPGTVERFRSHIEMGFHTIVMKGGFVYLSFWIILVMAGLLKWKYAQYSVLGMACWITVLVWIMFLYVEGYYTSIRNVGFIFVPFSIGYLISLEKKRISPKNVK